MAADYPPAVIIDNGSSSIKTGISGEDGPSHIFPSLIGHTTGQIAAPRETFIGSEAQSQREVLSLQYPISRGIITNWDNMESIWDYTFQKKLNLSPADQPLYITEVLLNPRVNKERMAQTVFETFNVPAMFVGIKPNLAYYAYGRTTGIVIQCGDGVMQTFPCCEGSSIEPGMLRQDFAGIDLTNYLSLMLREKGYSFSTVAERDIVRDIKQKVCRVALDYDQELSICEDNTKEEIKYELPDGSSISLNKECIQCPEALFRPSLLGRKGLGIHELAHSALMNVDIDARKDMYVNILLAGGSTLFPGMRERMQKEMEALLPRSMRVRAIAGPERRYSTWIGASIHSSLSYMKSCWFTRQHYDEYGPDLIQGISTWGEATV